MKYFFDNDISPRIPRMLAALGIDATPLRDRYAPNTDDSVFLAELKGGPFDVFISNNTEQRRLPHERLALREAGVISLYFDPFLSKLTFWPQATWIVTKWPKIEGFCRGTAKGTCADLQHNGKARYFTL